MYIFGVIILDNIEIYYLKNVYFQKCLCLSFFIDQLKLCTFFCFQAPEPNPPVAKGPPKSTTVASGKKGKLDEKPVEEQLDPVAEKLRQQR